jgi:hypothetical protein
MQAPDFKFQAKCLNQLQLQSAVFAVTKTFTAFNKLARSASKETVALNKQKSKLTGLQ